MEITIKTKHDLNQLVYVLYDNKVTIARIIDIQTITHNMEIHNDISIKYYLVDADDKLRKLGYYPEENVFSNKKQLLESL